MAGRRGMWIHYMIVNSCQCPNAEDYHLQLLHAKLWLSTFQKPSTAFTFAVLDDFLRDNLECGTSGMNYFSKLCWITSGIYLHMDRYQDLLRHRKGSPMKGDLALFCVACPQLGINVDPTKSLDELVAEIIAYVPVLTLHSWKHTCMVVMDRNFKAEHIKDRCAENQVWLMDRHGYVVTHGEYQQYLKDTPHVTDNLRKHIGGSNQIQIPMSICIVPRIGICHVHRHKKECYACYSPLFIKGAGWVDGEIIETLWSMLNVVSTSTCSMSSPH
ncbi:hypothetical protein EDC04DRAFT_2871557 [Pisolithus marmoratus]|nr:hypothetical protein EDC04DRAFT_2871557 [Pisolithus marmoratus]